MLLCGSRTIEVDALGCMWFRTQSIWMRIGTNMQACGSVYP
jgi:hypothetical protein